MSFHRDFHGDHDDHGEKYKPEDFPCLGCGEIKPGLYCKSSGYHYDCEPCFICCGTIKGCGINYFIPDLYVKVHWVCTRKMPQIILIQRWMKIRLEKLRLFNEHYHPDNFLNTLQGRRLLEKASSL